MIGCFSAKDAHRHNATSISVPVVEQYGGATHPGLTSHVHDTQHLRPFMVAGKDRPTDNLRRLSVSRPDAIKGTLTLGPFQAWRAINDKLALDILEDCNVGRKLPPADPHRVCLSGKPQPVVNRNMQFEECACASFTVRARSDPGAAGVRHAACQGALVDNLECLLAKLEQIVAMEMYAPGLRPIELPKTMG